MSFSYDLYGWSTLIALDSTLLAVDMSLLVNLTG